VYKALPVQSSTVVNKVVDENRAPMTWQIEAQKKLSGKVEKIETRTKKRNGGSTKEKTQKKKRCTGKKFKGTVISGKRTRRQVGRMA